MDNFLGMDIWYEDVVSNLVPDRAWILFVELWSTLRALGILCALAWLSYRIWQIHKIPRDQLEEKLGLEVPPVPDISIGGVSATSVKLYWLNSNHVLTTLTYSIDVNGIKVGDFRPGDSTIEILGLLPGNCYTIRISVINSMGNITSAPVIRVQTGYDGIQGLEQTMNEGTSEPAFIRTMPSRIDVLEPPNAHKDASGNRLPVARGQSLDQRDGLREDSEDSTDEGSPERVDYLVDRLENLKRQREDTDKSIEEEDIEFKCQIATLTTERDNLRQQFKEREDASADLRRHGNHLDKTNRSAQSRKAAKEKQLQQKKAERQKLSDDLERRKKEMEDMKSEMEEMKIENSTYKSSKDEFVDEKKKLIIEDQTTIKTLEEDIHTKGIQIKALEQRREELNVNDTAEGQQTQHDRESVDPWEQRYQDMQVQLANWRLALQQASMEEQQVKDRLSWWVDRRTRNPEYFAPVPSSDVLLPTHTKSKRSRHNTSRTSNISSPGYPGSSSLATSEPTAPPPFSTPGPFFSMGNGAAIAPGNGSLDIPAAELENLTGGAAMSPAATELLPSNLFRDDDLAGQALAPARDSNLQSGRDPFSRHGVSNSDASARGPNTPASAGSRTGSILPSPRDSLYNINNLRSRSDTFEDNDRQSIGSNAPSLQPSIPGEGNTLGSNRLASLFSSPFNRQRGRSVTHEPPSLGTLKQGESQSFPRSLEQDDNEATGNRRRRGVHNYWANPMAGLLNRNSAHVDGDDFITPRTSSGRKSRFNRFGSRYEDAEPNLFSDQQSSSRPSSTYSSEQVFGRPSSESQRPRLPVLENMPNRNSPLNAHRALPSGPFSHGRSRRASTQHGSTTDLSMGSTPLEPDDFPGPLKKQKSDQAPIGTRPQSSQRPATPRLNPAAQPFKFFGSKKGVKEEKSGSKLGERGGGKDTDKTDLDESEGTIDYSPSNPRLSRDAQSITTATSTADSHDSFDRSTSGTPSETMTPSSAREPRESLMQKITRKSSSSKFNVAFLKERSGGFFSKRTGEPSTPGEIDEDASSDGQLGRSVESGGGTPLQEKPGRTSISWSSIRRKPKKGEVADKGSEAGEEEY